MVDWIKNIWGKFKGYVIALAGAAFGVLCVVLGLKNRKIARLEDEKAAEAEKRRQAEKASEKARIDAETAAKVAAGSAEVDADTEARVAEVAQTADDGKVSGVKYNEIVEAFNEKTAPDN